MRANNLRYLRKKFQEKQTELCVQLGVTQNTLSGYETGKYAIPDDIAQKLAYHYRISVYDFSYSDLSESDPQFISDNGFLPAKNIIVQMLNALFPFIPPSANCKDESFLKAYEKICTLQQKTQNLQMIERDEMAECLLLFTDSWKEHKNENAVANCLSIMLMMCTGYYSDKNDQDRLFTDSIINPRALNYFDAQKIILRNIPNERKMNELTQKRLAFVRLYEEASISCMKRLKSSSDPDLRALADYFGAIMYLVGFVDNKFDSETNQRIGLELVEQLCKLKNRYAENFLLSYNSNIGIADI